MKKKPESQRTIIDISPKPPESPSEAQPKESPVLQSVVRMPLFAFKHQVEAYFAEQAEGGVLVEIGVDSGGGIQAMMGGSGVGRILPIYAVDPYLPCSDAFGSVYDGSQNKANFLQSIQKGGWEHRVFHIQKSGMEAAQGFDKPVAFLWIDLGLLAAEGAIPIFDAWKQHVIPGGVVGVPGLEHPRLMVEQFIAHVEAEGGWERLMSKSTIVAVFRKRPPKQAVFYIASDGQGGQYVREVQWSAASVKEHLNVPTHLFLDGKGTPTGFDSVRSLPPQRGPFWYLDSARYFCQAVEELWSAYDWLLYLDTDTHVCCPCPELWDLLTRFDLAIGHSPQRDCVRSAFGTPASFSTLEIGVNLFRKSEAMKGLLADWLHFFESWPHLYDNNDNGPFRDALWLNRHGVKWITLAPEFSLRYDFGAWVVGKVRILHGRHEGRSGNLQPVAEAINATGRMRLWQHKLI